VRSRVDVLTFWGLVALCWCLPQIPYLKFLYAPFTYLSVWVHELGHGVGALLGGGEFVEMVLTPEFGGIATTISPDTPNRILVLALGLLAPSIAGLIILVCVRGFYLRGITLILVSGGLLTSSILWSGDYFTQVLTLILAIIIGLVGLIGTRIIQSILAQVIGIEFCLNAIADFDYFFVRSATVGGHTLSSDTEQMAQLLGGTYTLWAVLLSILSILILYAAVAVSSSIDHGLKGGY